MTAVPLTDPEPAPATEVLEQRFTGLRRYNLVMGALHAAQAVRDRRSRRRSPSR